ncbi:MAG TPA: acyl-CoA dehydrogenase family protein [Ilumatobacter sp.]|nr:acyl-CoA dehydrogenase family protein [Ilumatobacter sp.]
MPKHLGITFFVIDMRQPGIETRPLRQMNGDAEFDEVFLTDAYVSDDRIIGGLGNGWKVAQTTLAYERTSISSRGGANASFAPGELNGFVDRRLGDLLSEQPSQTQSRIGGGYLLPRSAATRLAAECGRSGDLVLRQQLVDYLIRVEVNRLTGLRARANARGGRPGHEASIGKLALSDLARRSRNLGMSILGAAGMLSGDDAPHGGAVQHMVLSSFATGLGGGTDEIQRNVIGERALGLPREPQVDKDVPFSALLRS